MKKLYLLYSFSSILFTIGSHHRWRCTEYSGQECKLVLNEQSTDTVDVLSEAASAHPDPLTISDLRHSIGQAKAKAQGGTARGIQCLELTVQGHTSKEIGAIVGANPGTVRMWITRARKYLKGLPELRAFEYPEAV